MLKNIVRRSIREPLANIAVVIFAAVLAVILCHLQRSQEAELKSFEETYLSVPVYLSVTGLDGGLVRDYYGIEGWVVDLFFPDGKLQPNFYGLVKDLKLRLEIDGIQGAFSWTDENDYYVQLNSIKKQHLVGINSVRVAEELSPDSGTIRWYEGYDDSILETDTPVCLVNENWEGDDEVVLSFLHNDRATGEKRAYTVVFTVVGRYTAEETNDVYCPYHVMSDIYNRTDSIKRIRLISATLADNTMLEELKTTASFWFAKPNPLGNETEWGKYGYEYYPYAMDINDSLLQALVTKMENSMTINRLSSALIFLMSALAGFLTGFLVIRSRKREITLMRTLGNSHGRIYAEFALEQFLCILVGVLLGGSYALWRPLWKLALFVAVNFAGLSTALIVFLRVNLLSTMKEDE